MSIISDQLSYTLEKYENNNIDGDFYNGKVRDNYHLDDKIIMITTNDLTVVKEMYESCGADHILRKPFKFKELMEVVKEGVAV